MIKIINKQGIEEDYDFNRIVTAVNKSAERVSTNLSSTELKLLSKIIDSRIKRIGKTKFTVNEMHNIVEQALYFVEPSVARCYESYRNYKTDFVKIIDEVFVESNRIKFLGDKENSNSNSALVATQRCLVYNELSKRFYKQFFLRQDEIDACQQGYIYIHDMSARRDTMNCCLFDMTTVLDGGFDMGNIWYNEPKSLDTAFDVIGDIILSVASQQYGGFTVPEIDKVLDKYAEKSYNKYKQEAISQWCMFTNKAEDELDDITHDKIEQIVMEKIKRDFEQGFQGLEYKLNTVGSSRGDYPFTTFSFGISTTRFGKMASESILKVRMGGQGKDGNKIPVLFPKLVFLYDENLHGENKELEELFELSIRCSSKTMYPDYLSLTGEGYVSSIYKKYGTPISPMGCRAFLSPYYEKGGLYPADDNDKPVFVGRFNIGAISLNLPMIYAKSQKMNKDFYEVLESYLEMIRGIHLRTYNFLGEMKASTNPVAYCEGGFYGGNLNPNDKISSLLESATASFGITALNELQQLHNGKSIIEDGQFAMEVMKYINDRITYYKKQDGRLYAVYGTPAESLCGLQVEQFRKQYGIIKGVSDKSYVSNSFHCHVSEDISGIEKQDYEKRFWDMFNGGKIQYVKYPIAYNLEAIKATVRRAMELGFYEGVNLSLSYCNECGYEQLDMETCPKCNSNNLTKIDRMNGYLSYSRVQGDTRLNKAKMDEIKDRVSM